MRQWGAAAVVCAVLAVGLGVASGAVAFGSFSDRGVACGAPVAVAQHGRAAFQFSGPSGTRLEAVPSSDRSFADGLFGLSGIRLRTPGFVTACAHPARGRLVVAASALAGSVLALLFLFRRALAPLDADDLPAPGEPVAGRSTTLPPT